MINLCDLKPDQITDDQIAEAIAMQLICNRIEEGRWGPYWDLETRTAIVRLPLGDLYLPAEISGAVAASDDDLLRWRARPDSADWCSDYVSISFHVEEAW